MFWSAKLCRPILFSQDKNSNEFSYFYFSGPHRRGHIGAGGDAGGAGLGLQHRAVPLSGAAAARPRPLVLLPNVQVPPLLLLQELRLHALPLLVRILLRIQRIGKSILCKYIVVMRLKHDQPVYHNG